MNVLALEPQKVCMLNLRSNFDFDESTYAENNFIQS